MQPSALRVSFGAAATSTVMAVRMWLQYWCLHVPAEVVLLGFSAVLLLAVLCSLELLGGVGTHYWLSTPEEAGLVWENKTCMSCTLSLSLSPPGHPAAAHLLIHLHI